MSRDEIIAEVEAIRAIQQRLPMPKFTNGEVRTTNEVTERAEALLNRIIDLHPVNHGKGMDYEAVAMVAPSWNTPDWKTTIQQADDFMLAIAVSWVMITTLRFSLVANFMKAFLRIQHGDAWSEKAL